MSTSGLFMGCFILLMTFTQDIIVQFIELIINLHTHCLMQTVMNQEICLHEHETQITFPLQKITSKDLYITNFLKKELSEMIMK